MPDISADIGHIPLIYKTSVGTAQRSGHLLLLFGRQRFGEGNVELQDEVTALRGHLRDGHALVCNDLPIRWRDNVDNSNSESAIVQCGERSLEPREGLEQRDRELVY